MRADALEGLNGVSRQLGRGKLSGQQRSTSAIDSEPIDCVEVSLDRLLHSGPVVVRRHAHVSGDRGLVFMTLAYAIALGRGSLLLGGAR